MSIDSIWNNFKHDVAVARDQSVDLIVDGLLKLSFGGEKKSPDAAVAHMPSLQITDKHKCQPIVKPGNYSETILVNNVPRHFILHVPEGYDKSKPIPLVVALHGFTQDAADFQKVSGLDKDADQRQAAVLYPDATRWLDVKELAAWDTGNGLVPPGSHTDDVGFIRTAIDVAQRQLTIDKSRTYLLGVSNGGMEAYQVAAQLSDKIAALVDISGAMSGREKRPTSPVSELSIVGTQDDIVPPTGRTKAQEISVVTKEFMTRLGHKVSDTWMELFSSDEGQSLSAYLVEQSHFAPTFKPVTYATDFWKQADHIQGKPITTRNVNVTTDLYRNTKTGVAVEQVILAGADHAAQNGVPTTFRLNTVAWDFLLAHPKSQSLPTVPIELISQGTPHMPA